PRPDAEPHRGGGVLTLGVLSLVFSVVAPIGLTLGIIAWVMGQGDLEKMRRGEMDRQGQGTTTGGWVCGMIGVILSAILGLVLLMWFLSHLDEDDYRYRRVPRAAPVQK